MKRTEMLTTCKSLLSQLDDLQSVLGDVPKEDHPFIFRSVPDVRELLQIARYETDGGATAEQVTHINTITNKLNSIVGHLPRDLRKQFKKGR